MALDICRTFGKGDPLTSLPFWTLRIKRRKIRFRDGYCRAIIPLITLFRFLRSRSRQLSRQKNEGDLFPLKYTLFSATAFSISVSILSFSFFCCSNNSSFWIACLFCNLETSPTKAAFFAEIFYLALTAELTLEELELAMDFDLFTFLGDPASTLLIEFSGRRLIETASSSSILDCADCSH